MAKLARETQLVFASTPGVNQVTQIGSTFNGSAVYTNSIATIQALSNYLVGWFEAAPINPLSLTPSYPVIQDMNALHFLETYQLAYIMQEGIAEYDSGTTYYTGSLANDGSGNVYLSIANSNTGNALTNSTYWLPPGVSPSSLATIGYNLTIPSGYNWNVSFLTISSTFTVTIDGTAVFSGGTVISGTLVNSGTIVFN